MPRSISNLLYLPKLAKSIGAGLLHSLQFVAPLRLPCPSVVTVYDLGYLHFPETVERSRRAYYQWLVPRTLRRASAIVTISASTAADVARSFPEVAERVTPTPLGTPSWALAQFADTPLRLPGADAPFLFVGTLEPRKNLVRVLEAYERLLTRFGVDGRAEVPDLELVGAKGWNDSAIRSKLRHLLGTGKVRVHDYLDRDLLATRLAAARALLFPSLHEGFGFPILEAMAAGVPVLTADRGATAEVAGDAALLVDPTSEEAIVEGMERLICDPELSAELAIRGRNQIVRWSWERTAELTTAVYHCVFKARGFVK